MLCSSGSSIEHVMLVISYHIIYNWGEIMSIPDDIVDHSGTKGLTRKTKQAWISMLKIEKTSYLADFSL